MKYHEKELYRSMRRKYLIRFFIAVIASTVALLAGRIILFAIHPVWYEYETGYEILRLIDDNPVTFGILFLLFVTIRMTMSYFRKTASSIMDIAGAVNHIYEGHEDEIVLPKDYAFLESQLKQIQLDARIREQALHESNQRKNDMIMYMAHDLKTPLTSIIGYLTLLHDEKEIPEQTKEKYIEIAWNKSLRLEELINGFFDITRYNFTHMVLEKATVNMSMMLAQIAVEFEPIFKEKNLTYQLHIEPEVQVACDVDKMERVFDNLFTNIANYSYPNTEIEITLEKCELGGMKLITKNRGKTIPKQMQEHIFEQFFRMDSSRASNTGGSGLGLAITKEIVSLHGGTITCNSENEEIIFEVILPGGM